MTYLPSAVHPDIRINSYGWYLRKKFGCRVSKVNVDAGFTCPNRDGSRGVGGCIYCDNSSFSPGSTRSDISIEEQMQAGMAYHRQRLGSEKFVIYFQKFTNTYDTVERLRDCYTRALNHPDVIGISVGTRPDALHDDSIALLTDIARKKYVCLEIGLQSCDDDILLRINRGHTVDEYIAAVKKVSGSGLDICTHLIYGFPDESRDNFLKSVDLLVQLGINTVKLHQLHVVKGTRLEELYRSGTFVPLAKEEYIAAAADFLELLPATVSIQRLYGSAPLAIRVAPEWDLKNNQMWYAILNELKRRDSWQGKRSGYPNV
jgi:radical SAM protein (TIGR01212 family)